MLEELGQAPLRSTADPDGQEGSWTRVARFRGRSGRLAIARATIRNGEDPMPGRAMRRRPEGRREAGATDREARRPAKYSNEAGKGLN